MLSPGECRMPGLPNMASSRLEKKKKHLEEVIFQLSCNQYQQTALLLTGKLKVSDTSVNEHIKFGRCTYDIRIF